MRDPRRTRCVIAYDVSDDRPRARLADLLLNYGERMQGSVFEADLTAAEIDEVLRLAGRLVGADDSLRIYPLCADCAERVRGVGRPVPVLEVQTFRVL